MIKLVLTSTFVAFASAAITSVPVGQYSTRPSVYPSPTQSYTPLPPQIYNLAPTARPIAILRLESDIAPDGSYQWIYETENGISAQETGGLDGSGPDAGTSASGSYSYTSPEGVLVQISYKADRNGFQPTGNVLPTPPPTPEAILRSLEYNAAHPEPQLPVSPNLRNYST